MAVKLPPAPMPRYKVGDIVRHKTGGPKLLIAYVEQTQSGDEFVLVKATWFEGANYKDEQMYEHELIKLAADNGPIEGEVR